MKKVGITGSDGFIGWHVRAALGLQPVNFQAVLLPRAVFSDKRELGRRISECDVIVHLAGQNRGDEDELYKINIEITQKLIDACEGALVPHIIFASSTQINKENKYAKSKRESTTLLDAWSKKHKTAFTNLIIPNVFGEFGRPFYNSAIATFCHQMTRGEKSEVKKGVELELIYVQDLVQVIINTISRPYQGDLRLKGTVINLEYLYNKMANFKGLYDKNIIPDFPSSFDLSLFNTLRSFLPDTYYPRSLELRTDPRGSLFEMVKGNTKGQFFVSTTKPGVTRGNHYHTRKIERFCVIRGEAEIAIRRLFSKEVTRYKVNGSLPTYVDMPTWSTHNITNTGKETLETLFWSNEIFNPDDPDTYMETV